MHLDSPFIRTLIKILAIICLVGGVLGLFLPFLQGILLILLGVYLLSVASPGFKLRMDAFLMRHPRAKAHVDRHHARFTSFFKQKKHHASH